MITLLIATGIVFLLYSMFMKGQKTRVRGTASVIPERLPAGPLWSWGRGVWGLVLGPDLEKTLSAEVAEAMLAVSWGVSDAADLDQAERVMSEKMPAAKTWRLVRTAALVRLAVAGGVIGVADATSRLGVIASTLEALHDSWDDVADAFAAEHQTFLAEQGTDGERPPLGLARMPDGALAVRARAWLASDVWPDLKLRN